jgi:hypothetical protein
MAKAAKLFMVFPALAARAAAAAGSKGPAARRRPGAANRDFGGRPRWLAEPSQKFSPAIFHPPAAQSDFTMAMLTNRQSIVSTLLVIFCSKKG